MSRSTSESYPRSPCCAPRRLPAIFLCLLVALTALSATAEEYVLIDLSAGSGAASYPVSYLDEVPPGGWTQAHKTTTLVLRRIEPGTFMMGSPTTETGRLTDETLHQVTLTQPFYMGVFEVTQRQWELVMGDRPSYFNNPAWYAARPVEKVSYLRIRESGSDDPAVDWPANTNVSANSFVGRLRARTGLTGLDLPTEAQWEYACRAGTTTALSNGSDATDAGMIPIGRFLGNSGGGPGPDYPTDSTLSVGTSAAGTYAPNAWGLYDLHGNVWERCLDYYQFEYGTASVTNPVGPASNPAGNRVQRGGGFSSNPRNCRSARRYEKSPGTPSRDYGFRMALHVPAAADPDADGDGFLPALPEDDPLFDPDDTDPYTPFVDANGNFVPDNYLDDATSPYPDAHPRIVALRLQGTARVLDLGLSVGPVYQVELSTNGLAWSAVSVRIAGGTKDSFGADAPGTVENVLLGNDGETGWYRLKATVTPAR